MSKKRDKLEEKYEAIIELIPEHEVILELESNYGVEDIENLSVGELEHFLDYIISENHLESELEELEIEAYNERRNGKNEDYDDEY